MLLKSDFTLKIYIPYIYYIIILSKTKSIYDVIKNIIFHLRNIFNNCDHYQHTYNKQYWHVHAEVYPAITIDKIYEGTSRPTKISFVAD